jgi:hypothetical protein
MAWRRRNIFRNFWTQGNGGSQKELATAGRVMTRCTGIALRKEYGLRKKGQHDMAPFGKKHWKDPADRIGIKYPGGRGPRDLRKEGTTTNDIGAWTSRQQLLPGSGRMHMKALYEMGSVKIVKRNADLLPGCGASRTGHCGGVGPL